MAQHPGPIVQTPTRPGAGRKATGLGRVAVVLLLGCLGKGAPAAPLADNPADCEALAATAGAAAGLPDGLLPAIARIESSRNGRAWPWTLNQGGAGSYYDKKSEATAALDAILAQNISNVDLGCMQLNWRWHAQAFPDAATMLDPAANTRYAAAFLAELFARTGDWDKAVALYHSRDADRGAKYRDKVMAMVDAMPETAARAADQADTVTLAQSETTTASQRRMARAITTNLRGLLAVSGAPIIGASGGEDLRTGTGQGLLQP